MLPVPHSHLKLFFAPLCKVFKGEHYFVGSTRRFWETLKSFEGKAQTPTDFEEVKEKSHSKETLRSDGTWEGGEGGEPNENLKELNKTLRLGLILVLVCVGYVTLSRLTLSANETKKESGDRS